jgi:hypothetical protein
MRNLLFSVATVLSLCTGAASGEEPGAQQELSCLKWPVAMVAAQANNPDAQLVRVLQGDLAHDFVTIVNQLPPVSTFDGDHVALFFRKSDSQFLVVIGEDQCAKHVVELPAAIFARMIGQEA